MTEFTLSVPCLFGLEGLCAQELRRLDMKEVAAENGRVLFKGTFEDIIRQTCGFVPASGYCCGWLPSRPHL